MYIFLIVYYLQKFYFSTLMLEIRFTLFVIKLHVYHLQKFVTPMTVKILQ